MQHRLTSEVVRAYENLFFGSHFADAEHGGDLDDMLKKTDADVAQGKDRLESWAKVSPISAYGGTS